jgi:hypothetical protein
VLQGCRVVSRKGERVCGGLCGHEDWGRVGRGGVGCGVSECVGGRSV